MALPEWALALINFCILVLKATPSQAEDPSGRIPDRTASFTTSRSRCLRGPLNLFCNGEAVSGSSEEGSERKSTGFLLEFYMSTPGLLAAREIHKMVKFVEGTAKNAKSAKKIVLIRKCALSLSQSVAPVVVSYRSWRPWRFNTPSAVRGRSLQLVGEPEVAAPVK